MTRATPELAHPLQTSEPHQREGAIDPIHDRSLVESGFEPGALRFRGRQFSTKPKRTHFSLKRYKKRYRSSDIVAKKAVPGPSHLGDKSLAVLRTLRFFLFISREKKQCQNSVSAPLQPYRKATMHAAHAQVAAMYSAEPCYQSVSVANLADKSSDFDLVLDFFPSEMVTPPPKKKQE
ncbi:hypothetical protein AVEN_89562-1 [Araneus ventricosus]|uniref:Uncharacterized protein n=1 Tax=Araneus ventricosus TaxID=182803 RepID=A0A4Y2GUN3_ARAVE|nr:hypothetical protein AVEN_89562-1 [Araneus ventricosus]